MRVRRFLPSSLGAGLFLLSLAPASRATTIRGTILDSRQSPVANAAVWVMDTAAWPRHRALTDAEGKFTLSFPGPDGVGVRSRPAVSGFQLDKPGTLFAEVKALDGRVCKRETLTVGAGNWRLDNLRAFANGLPKGTWVVECRAGASKWTRKVVSLGRDAGHPKLVAVGRIPATGRATEIAPIGQILVRKAGFEALSLALPSSDTALSLTISDGRFEKRIDSVMATMTLADKIGQMTQGLYSIRSLSAIASNRLGSVLSGGGDPLADYNVLQAQSQSTARKIPLLYGVDAVHGHAKREGGTVLPHNIGLGATRDTALLRRLGENTAKELWAGNADWAFAPCLAVARDERWGRTYESFGEVPELAARLGSAYIKGLQGDAVSTPWRVVACAKHYLADGGTTYGTGTTSSAAAQKILNEGDARISQGELDSLHMPPYLASVAAGVGTLMASYSSFNGVKMHAHKALLTDSLKTDFAFDGFVVSDWLAVEQLKGTFSEQVATAINAGIDMSMEPKRDTLFISTLTALAGSGGVPQSRIDDAVRRILRVKFRQGLFESSERRTAWDTEIGSVEHRALAREAVRKSLVVLKNDNTVLPLPKTGKTISVVGTHADNTGLQCGGWTKVGGMDNVAWNGAAGVVQGATSILAGFKSLAGASIQTAATGADVVVVVAGEQPYAETSGDKADLPLPAQAATLLATAKAAGQKTVLVLVSGRPLVLGEAAANADAIVAAWLPGSEGAGVADVLLGDVAPVGKLPMTWPASIAQLPINIGDAVYAPLYPYGHGLTW